MQLGKSVLVVSFFCHTLFCADFDPVISGNEPFLETLPKELIQKVFNYCDLSSQFNLSATNKFFNNTIIIEQENLALDLQTRDFTSVPRVYNTLWNGYIRLTGVMPFNKELVNKKTISAFSSLASKRMKLCENGFFCITNYTQPGWNNFVQRIGMESIKKVRLEKVKQPYINDFFEMVKTNNSITHLELWHNQINGHCEGSAGLVFSAALKINTTLKSLHLCTNNVEAEHLFIGLKENKSLTELVAMDECLSPLSIQPLQDMLNKNSTLKKLHIWASVGRVIVIVPKDGICALARMLKVNTVLTDFALTVKVLDSNEMVLFADALATNTTLKKLSLGATVIMRDEGVVPLIEAFKKNTTLEDLTLDGFESTFIKEQDRHVLSVLSDFAPKKPGYRTIFNPRKGLFRCLHDSVLYVATQSILEQKVLFGVSGDESILNEVLSILQDTQGETLRFKNEYETTFA